MSPEQTETIRVYCVDDHSFIVEGLRARFALEPDIEFVGSMGTAEGLLPEIRRTAPDIVLLDIDMPGPDPFEAVSDLQRRFPDVRAVMLSAYVREHYFESAVESGAWGYLSKSDDPDQIVEGIRKVVAGEFALGREVEQRVKLVKGDESEGARPVSRLRLLTVREQEILRMIGKGMSRNEIAATLHRSPKTVDAHRGSLMEKLGIHDRVDLVRYAIREGLVEP